ERSNLTEHPIDLFHRIEPLAFQRAKQSLGEPMPDLAALVVLSAFDAAAHDAFGKRHGKSVYECYGPEHLPGDLSRFLGPDYAGLTLAGFLRQTPVPSLPLYHLVGALDPLTTAEVQHPVGDGLPETLSEWILSDGLTHLKMKLNGQDARWDEERIRGVNRVAMTTAPDRHWYYSLDFNERCPNADYLLEILERLQHDAPDVFARIQYIEQPTGRDLWQQPANPMHKVAKRVPVVIDESLTSFEALDRAQQLGYTGVALKACKGQSATLLHAVAARRMGLFLCVQDLTCPGASLIQSAGLAAHIPGVMAIEANSRQYCPAANAGWETRFPGLFTVRNGRLPTGTLTGPGLGAVS
ncbi:MAG: enolase C-terminal domain-like protein, partial [Gemmataceae bacterium]